MPKEVIKPTTVHKPSGYSHAFKTGNTVYMAGQAGFDQNFNIANDFNGQLEQTIKNIQGVLAASGGSLSNIVHMTWYLVGKQGNPLEGEVFRKYFKEPYPAATVFEVTGLFLPSQLIEIDVVAAIEP